MTRLLSNALKVVLKHRNENGVVLVAGDKDLLCERTSFTYLLDSRRRKNTCTCAGIKNGVNSLLVIKLHHTCHKASGVFFCEKSTKTDVFALGFFSYKFIGVSYC